MKLIAQDNGCKLFQANRIMDNRGWFSVQFNATEMQQYGFNNVVQLNHSLTEKKGTIRGFNYQSEPFQQFKIVRCVRGKIYSVAVNIDPSSSDFGKWCGYELTEDDDRIMLIPKLYAHGFISLLDNSEMEYFTDEIYSYENAKSIRYDDPEIGVDWTLNGIIEPNENCLSDKNRNAISFSEYRRETRI